MEQEYTNYVGCIVEEGSISNAAKRLGISQPALSARIRRIETEYGISIFRKDRRQPILTDEGKRYMEFMARMQSLDRGFRRYISDTHALNTGEIRIGGTYLYTQCFLPEVAAVFHRRYPGVRIKLINEKVPELAGMTAKGELDLFISSPGKRVEGIAYEPLFPARLYLCVPSSYKELNGRLADFAVPVSSFRSVDVAAKSLDVKVLEGCTFILLEEYQHMGRVLRSVFRRYGVSPGDFIYTDQAMTAFALTAAGAGISLMFDRTIEKSSLRHNAVYYTIDDGEMTGDLSVAYTDETYLSEAAKAFIRCIREVYQ